MSLAVPALVVMLSGLLQAGDIGGYDQAMRSAEASLRLGRLNESIGWLEKAAAHRPDASDVYKLLGLNYALGGMLPESEKAFRRAVALDPANWELHYLLGRALYETEAFAASQVALDRAIELHSASVRAWTALGQVQERTQDYASAGQSYRRAVELCAGSSADCSWPLFQLGFLLLRQQGDREAEPYFRRAVTARPDWAKPHFYLGKTLASLDRLAEARSAVENAVRLDEARSEYHYQLSQICRRLGDVATANRHLARYRALVESGRKSPSTVEFPAP